MSRKNDIYTIGYLYNTDKKNDMDIRVLGVRLLVMAKENCGDLSFIENANDWRNQPDDVLKELRRLTVKYSLEAKQSIIKPLVKEVESFPLFETLK